MFPARIGGTFRNIKQMDHKAPENNPARFSNWEYPRASANCVRAPTGFWLRENVRLGSGLAETFRFTIGGCTYSGSVASLENPLQY